jgi:uncharacterized glyoxalase superfamily protein PhnB
MTDPFDALASPLEPQTPRPAFARDLRNRLVAELGLDPATALPTDLPTIDLPPRSRTMPTTSQDRPRTEPAVAANALVPYITVARGEAALDWYVEALGAVETLRVPMDDGRLGHAELLIGDAKVMLSDEYPELGVQSPDSLGGTSAALHLTVPDVDDRFARAIAAGARVLREPADQEYGYRQGTFVDPFGHRWTLSQPLAPEIAGTGPGHNVSVASRPGTGGGIWAGCHYTDPLAAIRLLCDVFGFEEQLVVLADDGRTVVHSQLRWPEGGIVQVGTYDPDNIYSHAPGEQALYVVTAHPEPLWERCQAAGLEVILEPHAPDHDPDGMSFGVRDREGNIWTFGTYGLGA